MSLKSVFFKLGYLIDIINPRGFTSGILVCYRSGVRIIGIMIGSRSVFRIGMVVGR